MSGLLWVKMPSKWINDGALLEHFSSKNISTEIAALKIYVCLCLSAKVVTHSEYSSFLGQETYLDRFESRATYNQLMDSVSLSRVLISRGLKKLVSSKLMHIDGSTRKKIYVLTGMPNRSWCKLPRKDLIKKNETISAFTSFTHRYTFERDALKLFLYFLSIRTNSKRYVEVSRGQIYTKTGVKIDQIDGVLGFLRSVGLLEKIESKGYKKTQKPNEPIEFQKLHRYWVAGNSSLNIKRVLIQSDDVAA